jgi:hypothetical protein
MCDVFALIPGVIQSPVKLGVFYVRAKTGLTNQGGLQDKDLC